MKRRRCEQCGAPLRGDSCAYCGAQYEYESEDTGKGAMSESPSGLSGIELWALVLISIAALLAFPLARHLMWLILPLGSGMDDLIFIACSVLGGILYAVKKYLDHRKVKGEE